MLLVRQSLLFMFFLLPLTTFAKDLPPDAEKGEAIFTSKCSACHTVGQGKLVGPDLKGVTDRRDTGWLKSFIKNPQDLLNKKDPTAVALFNEFKIQMPASGLKDAEIEAVISYLRASSGGGPAEQAKLGGAVEPQKGDPDNGMALFTGKVRFANGGPSCVACHTISGLSTPGGSLGPDLSGAFSSYDRDGLQSVLTEIPFPTMLPVYKNRAITEKEKADLIAFLEKIDASQKPKSFSSAGFLIFSGIVVLFALMQITWGTRLKNVRKPLLMAKVRR